MCLLEILHFTCACNIQHLNRCDGKAQMHDLASSMRICPLYSILNITAFPSVYPCPRGHSVHDVLLPSMVGYNLNYCIDGAERGRVGEFEPPIYTDEEGFHRPRKPGGWDDKWWEGAMVGRVSSQRRQEELMRLKGEFWTKESKHVHPGAKGLWGTLKRGHEQGLEAMRGDEDWERVPKPIKKVAGLAERSRSRRGKRIKEGRMALETVHGEMSGARFDGPSLALTRPKSSIVSRAVEWVSGEDSNDSGEVAQQGMLIPRRESSSPVSRQKNRRGLSAVMEWVWSGSVRRGRKRTSFESKVTKDNATGSEKRQG